MFRYGKTARQAVAAATYLAACHGKQGGLVSSGEVARARQIPPMLAAKVLSVMAGAGLLIGTPGPKGGYRLNRSPGQIHLMDVIRLFDSENENLPCPFGPDWCGNGAPCPLHESFAAIREMTNHFLSTTTLAGFVIPVAGPAAGPSTLQR